MLTIVNAQHLKTAHQTKSKLSIRSRFDVNAWSWGEKNSTKVHHLALKAVAKKEQKEAQEKDEKKEASTSKLVSSKSLNYSITASGEFSMEKNRQENFLLTR